MSLLCGEMFACCTFLFLHAVFVLFRLSTNPDSVKYSSSSSSIVVVVVVVVVH